MQIQTARELAAVVRARRKKMNWTQMDLAKSTGTGRDWVIDLEKGKATLELGLVLRMLRVLGLAIHLEPVQEPRQNSGIDLNDLLDETQDHPLP